LGDVPRDVRGDRRAGPLHGDRRGRDRELRHDALARAELSLLEQPAVVDVERGLRAVGELELAEDVRDVRLHRALGDAELRADLLVRATGGDELQDLALARGEIAVALVVIGRRWPAAAQAPELVEHAARD